MRDRRPRNDPAVQAYEGDGGWTDSFSVRRRFAMRYGRRCLVLNSDIPVAALSSGDRSRMTTPLLHMARYGEAEEPAEVVRSIPAEGLAEMAAVLRN